MPKKTSASSALSQEPKQLLQAHQQQLIESWVKKLQGGSKVRVARAPTDKDQEQKRWYAQMLRSDDALCFDKLYNSHYFEHWDKESKCYRPAVKKIEQWVDDVVQNGAANVQWHAAPWVMKLWKQRYQDTSAPAKERQESEFTHMIAGKCLLGSVDVPPLIDALYAQDANWVLSQAALVFNMSKYPVTQRMHLLYKLYALEAPAVVHERVREEAQSYWVNERGNIFSGDVLRDMIALEGIDKTGNKEVPTQWKAVEKRGPQGHTYKSVQKASTLLTDEQYVSQWLQVAVAAWQISLDDVLDKVASYKRAHMQEAPTRELGSYLVSKGKEKQFEHDCVTVSHLLRLEVSEWLLLRGAMGGKMEAFCNDPMINENAPWMGNKEHSSVSVALKQKGICFWEQCVWHMGIQAVKKEGSLKRYPLLEQEIKQLCIKEYQSDPTGFLEYAVEHQLYEVADAWGCSFTKQGQHISALVLEATVQEDRESVFKRQRRYLIGQVRNLEHQKIQGIKPLEYLDAVCSSYTTGPYPEWQKQQLEPIRLLRVQLEQKMLAHQLRAQGKQGKKAVGSGAGSKAKKGMRL